jgi:hypothetical protein
MMTSMIRRVAAGAAVAGLGLAMAPGAAQASAPVSWRAVFVSRAVTGYLFAVEATGPRDAWAVGNTRNGTSTVFMHWDGVRWRTVPVPAASGFGAAAEIAASSKDNVWLLGFRVNQAGTKALRFDGVTWRTVPVPPDAGGNPVVLGPDNVWLSGGGSCTVTAGSPPQCVSTIWHWDGRGWSSQVVPALIEDMAGMSADHVWYIALTSLRQLTSGLFTGRPVMFRWNGAAWTPFPVPSPRVREFPAIAASSNRDLWLEQSPVRPSDRKASLLHWDGRRWTEISVPSSLATGSPPVPDGHGGVWLGPWAHWTGRRWVNTLIFNGLEIAAVARIPGSSSVWGVGYTGASISSGHRMIAIYGPLP